LVVGVLAQPAVSEAEVTVSKSEAEVTASKSEAEATESKSEAKATESKSEAKVTASKQEMIRELLTIAGIVGMAEQMRDQQAVVELMQMQPSYHEMMEWATSEQTDLAEADRQLLLARLADFDAFAERFRTLFNERLNFSTIIETVYPPLYDKTFSEEELRQMVTFYRTPVGRKSIEVMPSLMQEAAAGVEGAVRPLAIGLVQEIVAEERAKLAD
jgi:hypothetical protein